VKIGDKYIVDDNGPLFIIQGTEALQVKK